MSNTENVPSLLPAQAEFNMFQVIARNAQNSGLYGNAGGESKIFMILLAARELGIPPMLALNGGIWNIQGKIEISARLMNSMIRRAGHMMEIKSTDKECVIKAKRSDTGEEHTETFTIEMAQRAGLATRDTWKKYPEDMLYNRCMSRLARRLFPDVIGTAYVEGEIRESIESEKKLPVADYQDVTDVTDIISTQTKINPDPKDHINDLLKQVTEKQQNDLWSNLEEAFKLKSRDVNDIPEQAFQRCENFLLLCIDINKRKQAA